MPRMPRPGTRRGTRHAGLPGEDSHKQHRCTIFCFSSELPGPRESAAGHLSRPDNLLGHLGVQDRLYVSTTVVSTALASGQRGLLANPLARKPSQDREGPLSWEPPIGIEPVTYALREARARAAHALAAPIARVIALIAFSALGLSGDPVHEPVHAQRLRPRVVCDVARLPERFNSVDIRRPAVYKKYSCLQQAC
jgi:hypothetical protein